MQYRFAVTFWTLSIIKTNDKYLIKLIIINIGKKCFAIQKSIFPGLTSIAALDESLV